VLSLALMLASGAARADVVEPRAPLDSLPGSATPPGLGLAPEAPPVAPTAGGRAPSFGSPDKEPPALFRIGGRFYGWEAIGIGSRPGNPQPGYSGTPLHMPLLSIGKIPFWGGAGATLNVQYGNRYVTAAKKLVAFDCAIEFLAGPTEAVIISADGDPACIASDLVAQAEHDPDALCIFITTSRG